jgi:hypothetical protein
MKTRRQLTPPPKREPAAMMTASLIAIAFIISLVLRWPVDSVMTGLRAQWQSGLETLSGIRQWKLRLQLAGRTGSNHKPDQLGEYIHEQNH